MDSTAASFPPARRPAPRNFRASRPASGVSQSLEASTSAPQRRIKGTLSLHARRSGTDVKEG